MKKLLRMFSYLKWKITSRKKGSLEDIANANSSSLWDIIKGSE